ncbi:uncharacterized protein TRIADDRAFT_62454 [Trichoplax adhaerens]|uniref:NB-ARC domain-containing protein n=1 Tax=Trichoplax adhaerens TaxID=10228 RepID=B3SDU7_TRIAD|nr:predicted protein [Trichoplax adhaerens]EDV19093.1 predicted protein [Trichoplax adhaerens]|eukprot:XP_002118416.1 predicted protein [Trichoplax adhaerens]
MFKRLKLRKHSTTVRRNVTQHTKDQSIKQIHLFISSFILEFIQKLILYDRISTGDIEAEIGRNFEQYQQFISDFAKPLTSLLGSEISVPINLGLTITTFAARKLKKKLNKEKASKIISILPPDDSSSTLFVALLACDICRMYEHQILSAAQDTGCLYLNIRKLAKAAAKRVLNHMAKSNSLSDNSVIRIMDNKSNSYNQLVDLYGNCVSGVYYGFSKNSSEKLFAKNRDLKIACGDLLTQLGLVFGGVGEKGKGSYAPSQIKYIKQWGYRRPSIIFDYHIYKDFELKITDDGKLPSDKTFTDRGWIVVQFDTSDWKNYKYLSPLSSLHNFESLREYAISALKKTLTNEDEQFTAQILSDLKIKVQSLPNKEDLHKEIDDVMKILDQMITKEGVEKIVNKLQNGIFSEIGKAIGLLNKAITNIDKLQSDFSEFKETFSSKIGTEIPDKGDLCNFRHQENNFNSDYDLIGIPDTPAEMYITRKEFVGEIVSKIVEIQNSSKRSILIYGIGGGGKTVAVSQAVQQVAKMPKYKSRLSAYWITLGDSSDDELLTKLKLLAYSLGISFADSDCNDLNVLGCLIRKHIRENSSGPEILFIFDDLWDDSYMSYLDFYRKAIIISRNKTRAMLKTDQIVIEANTKLTKSEAFEVFRLNQPSRPIEDFTKNRYISEIIERCQGLPLMISLIAAQKLTTEAEWLEYLIDLQKNLQIKNDDSYFSTLHKNFNASIEKLQPDDQKLFIMLGIFRKSKISVNLIGSLWKLPLSTVRMKLQQFHCRSLLTSRNYKEDPEYRTDHAILHDLMVDHLKNLLDNEWEKHGLHEDFVLQTYIKHANNWDIFKGDQYFWNFITDHAIASGNQDIIKKIATDVRFLDQKLKYGIPTKRLSDDANKFSKYFDDKDQEMNHLSQILLLHSCFLLKNNSDFTQFVLNFSNSDYALYENAIIEARERRKYGHSFHVIPWVTEMKVLDDWQASISVGTSFSDVHRRFACTCLENLDVICTFNNGHDVSTISVRNYISSMTQINIRVEKRHITNAILSATGKLMAYRYVNASRNQTDISEFWEVWDLNEGKKMNIRNQRGEFVSELDSECMSFSSMDESIVITLTSNKKKFKCWKVQEMTLRQVCESREQNFQTEGFDFVENGSNILSWHKNFNHGDSDLQECEIMIWDVKSLRERWIMRVPYSISNMIDDTFVQIQISCLKGVKYFIEDLLLLNYNYALGMIPSKEIEIGKANIAESFCSSFFFIHQNEYIIDFAISNNSPYIAILTDALSFCKILILRYENKQVFTSTMIKCLKNSVSITFMPGMLDLWVYNSSNLAIYQYGVQNYNSQDPIDDTVIVASESTCIGGMPIVARIGLKDQGTVFLEVNRGLESEKLSCCNISPNAKMAPSKSMYKIFLIEDLKSLIIVEISYCNKNCHLYKDSLNHSHIVTMRKDFDNINENVWINYEVLNVNREKFKCKFEYRRCDNILICILWLSETVLKFNVLAYETGDILATLEDDSYYSTFVYHDEFSFVIYCRTSSKMHYIKVYEFESDKIMVKQTNLTTCNKATTYLCYLSVTSHCVSPSNFIDIDDSEHLKNYFEQKYIGWLRSLPKSVYFYVRIKEDFVVYDSQQSVRSIGYRECSINIPLDARYAKTLTKNFVIYLYGGKIYIHRKEKMQLVQNEKFNHPYAKVNFSSLL